ncbi:general substrate transporter [Microdochium trichocladiopsis]|uniref:General substrate transporter n=1 Tax=Microdochium trichocladiopsis TaxID=1682393 RepID=A0A9P9BG09_9PEZI|nr:general substrate transporter [Microdochium trichocladiopsis]KAH7014174.1 general substrate transporter [Microdochium trichocladiopsis]
MGLFKRNKTEAETAVGPALAAVLPDDPRPFYKVRHLLLLNLMLLVVSLSSATIGFDGAMMNGLQTVAQWRDYFGRPSPSILGVMNAIYPIGKLMAVFPASWMADKYGRRAPMIAGFVMLIIGAGLQGGSVHIAMFIISRWFLGFATAFLAQPAPILVTELAFPTHRGKITACYQTFFFFGAILAAWSTYGTLRIPSTWSWRIPSLLQGAIPAFQFALFWFVPESPRWLVANGRTEDARAILAKWHAGGDEGSPLVAYEVAQIEETVKIETEVLSETSYMDLLRTPANRRRAFIAVIVGFFAQWNGAGVISYYLALVLNTIGITESRDQALINGLLQVFNLLAAIFAGAMMVDRLGRRTLFLVSTAGMFFSYVIWTALTGVFTTTLNQNMGNAVVAFIFIYYFFYDIAWSPLLLAYPVEIFQYTLRARGVSVTYAATFIGLIIGQFSNPLAMAGLGWKYYIVFCCILACLFVLIWFTFPETKGRSLEEIAEIFEGPSAGKKAADDEEAAAKAKARDIEEVEDAPGAQKA